MGQCQYCRGSSNVSSTDAASDKNLSYTLNDPGRHSGSDSALDSGHSCCDEASLHGEEGRSGSNSSESSGKYSLRESVGSCVEFERSNSQTQSVMQSPISPRGEVEVFGDSNTNLPSTSTNEDYLHPLHNAPRSRKVSKGSNCSERGSVSSVSSITAVLQARLVRSISLKVRSSRMSFGTTTSGSSAPNDTKQPRRAVSLRLPRSHKRGRGDADTNLPTIYVEDSPQAKQQQMGRQFARKSSLRRALSLLSMNSLVRQEAAANQAKQQKPVQKILRQPRRRHNTVRGLSGMAIDDANQGGLRRAGTLYYPTATSLRRNYAARRTYSDNQT